MRSCEQMFERRLEVAYVDVAIGQQQKFCERELSFAEDAEGAGHRLTGIPLLDHGGSQRVISRLAIRPQSLDGRHHHWKQRPEEFLKQIADVEVLLPRLADHRG